MVVRADKVSYSTAFLKRYLRMGLRAGIRDLFATIQAITVSMKSIPLMEEIKLLALAKKAQSLSKLNWSALSSVQRRERAVRR